MGSGSISVDTIALSQINWYLVRVAEDIDMMRQYIVPLVYNVVDTALGTHSSWQERSSLGTTNASIASFNHEAQVVVQNLRTSVRELQWIIDDAGHIKQQVDQLPTAGQGDSSWWHQLSSNLNTGAGSITSLLGSLDEDFIKGLEGIPPEKLKFLARFIQAHPELQNVLRALNSEHGIAGAAVFGILTDFLSGTPVDGGSGQDYSPRAFLSKTIGGLLGTGIALTGVGAGAIVTLGVINLGGNAMASGQTAFGNAYGGAIGRQLQEPVQGLQQASNDANSTKFLDSIGQDIVDRAGDPRYVLAAPQLLAPIAALNGVASMFGLPISRPEDVSSDDGRVLSNGWHLIRSVPEFLVNAQAVGYDDLIALGNRWIQNNEVLPSPLRDFSNTVSGDMIGLINGSANFITKMWSFG